MSIPIPLAYLLFCLKLYISELVAKSSWFDRFKIVMSCQLSTKGSIDLKSWRNWGICWLVLMLGIQLLLPNHFLTCSIWPTWQKKFKLRTEEGSSYWRRVILRMRTLPWQSRTLKRPWRGSWLSWRRPLRNSLMLWRTRLWIWS